MSAAGGRPSVTRLAMIYDADGGLVGEIRYVVGHLLGRTECFLCDITHGRVSRKHAFDELVDRLPMPVTVVHRNEQEPALAEATRDLLPCVMAETADGWELLVGREALHECHGDVAAFDAVLSAALADR